MNPTLDRWLDAIKVAIVTIGVAWAYAVAAGPSVAAGAVVGGLVGTWLVSPLTRVGRHTPHEVATAAAGREDTIVYWRPGCTVCLRLLATLASAERDAATWVNVVRDPAAAAFVRGHRDGDMVTPTAVTGDGRLVEASVESLRERLPTSPPG